ncbi:putative membrane protein [Haloechinothrix alba]|uniref:Putative membrane protein n=1 Tax=Haloechinothrix alba TaxID=664784 RepID=A0A238W5F7_9PSEU|nr:YhgE/Pip family protein [Haloechinothrix alba]SNR41766.1 putative membrane protein [Haloechinothrix alba]
MLNPLANTARAHAPGPLSWRTWAGLVVIPVLVLGLLTWAFAAPHGEHDDARAAVVNNDEPVEIDGQMMPIGRELAAKLTQDDDPGGYSWVLTDAEDARSGVDDGSYVASVTIPETFSAHATSTANEDPMEATRALLEIEVSDSAGLADPQASKRSAEEQVDELNREVVQSQLEQIYGAFTEMHDQLGEAVDGAFELAGGAGELAGGAEDLAGGAGELNRAAQELAGGAEELAAGTGELSAGAGELADGLGEARDETARLPELTRKLAEGAREVAKGNRQIADTVAPLADRVIDAVDALPSAKETADKLGRMAERCADEGGEAEFCEQLTSLSEQVSEHAAAIDGATSRVRDAAVQAKEAVTGLADGAEQVADGNERLADEMPGLTAGIAEAADGADELHSGIVELDSGAAELATGARGLAGGTSRLSGGAAELAGGADDVHGGTEQLASELDDGQDEVPNYDEDEREHLSEIAATPTAADVRGTPDFGRAAVALFMALALWAGGLATYLVTRAVPPEVLTSRDPSWKIILRAAVPGATIATISAVAVSLILWPVLGLSFGEVMAFLGVSLLAAAAFMVLNQALVAIFKRPGRFVSVAVLVLTLGINVISTVPASFSALGALLPTQGAVRALSAITTGASGGYSGVLELAIWLVIGSVAMIAVTDRRRVLPAKHLRAGSRT